MSRIGRMNITIPAGVTVSYNDRIVNVKGPKGELSQFINDKFIDIKIEGNNLEVVRNSENKQTRSKHGLYRMLIDNMVKGVVTPFTKVVIIQGVGFKAQVNNGKLVMNIGYSHPVEFVAPKGITITVGDTKTQNAMAITPVTVTGISKEQVGQVAATIKSKRPVEPYHNYGLHYAGQVLVKKEGKTAGK